MANIIAAGAVIIVVVLAVRYIIKQKKNGAKCIGCSERGTCNNRNNCTK